MNDYKKTKSQLVVELSELRKRISELEQKNALKKDSSELKQDANLYLSLVEQSQDAIYLLFNGKFEYINRKFSEIFHITLEEANSCDFDFFDLVAPESRSIIEERLRKVASNLPVDAQYEFTALTKNGKKIIVDASVSYIPYKDGIATQGILRDITERKEAEDALRKSETQYNLITSNMTDSIWLMDMGLKTTWVTPSTEHSRGYTLEEMSSLPLEKHLAPESFERAQKIISSELTPEKLQQKNLNMSITLELEFYRKDGTTVWSEARLRLLRDSRGNPIGILGVGRDITDRKKAEDALKQREHELFIKTCNLEEVNMALKVLLRQRDNDRLEFEKRILSNVKKLVTPYIRKLKRSMLNVDQKIFTDILESNINELLSPFVRTLSAKYMDFTSQEIQVANLVKEGKTNKDIAELLNVTERTVCFHRENIRNKLGMKKKKINLRSYLIAIS